MNEVYEYRRIPGRGIIRLAAAAVVVSFTTVALTGAQYMLQLACVIAPLALLWMSLPRPIAGIRIDDESLILSAWQNPRAISLDDLSHIQILNDDVETNISIHFKDGRTERAMAHDFPPVEILAVVLATRGIPVRGIY